MPAITDPRSLFERARDEYLRTGAIAGFSGGDGSDDPAGDPPQTDDDPPELGDAGREAIRREREARRSAERERADLKQRLDALEAAAHQREADEAKAKGEWEKLAQQRETELADLKAKLAAQEQDARRQRFAAKYHLPDSLRDRLQGETDEAVEADAKALAKIVNPEAADTEAGAGRRGQGAPKISATPPATPARDASDKPPAYSFIPAGAVRIPDGV